jgi:uncharacterized protein
VRTSFEGDDDKNRENLRKHQVPFEAAQYAFADPQRVIARDLEHSEAEERYFCFGLVEGGVLTVRFTHRGSKIRVFGAGYWRKGMAIYEKQNKVHK